MGAIRLAALVLWPWLTLASGSIWAEVVEVRVMDNRFLPNDVTINVGDTIQWTNAPGGMAHDVVDDAGSFQSEIASSFTFEHTFSSPGEILYHCTVHSSPGLDRDQFMNGRVVVQGQAEVLINQGMNDIWANSETPGQGFFVMVFADIQRVFVGWFTFDVERPDQSVTAVLGEPGHRWITAFGPYSGNTATLDIEITKGGIFNAAEPVPEQPLDGTLTLRFDDCLTGEFEFNIPSISRSGVIPVARLANDNVPLCESLQAQ